jgi:cation diffusion facilitator CzcD-associated flavoprotein CzcO
MRAGADHRRRSTRVAVIGAGQSGVVTAVQLQRAGYRNFTVFERSAGPGGTWFDNRFPGCAVDVHSHVYSFAFMPYDWSRNYANQPEVLRYLEDTIDQFGVRDRFQFGCTVESAVWNEQDSAYRVNLADGRSFTFDVVVSCLGLLNNPYIPQWDGLDAFRGPAFHTARWEQNHDLTKMRVAVVGTGSTAAQVVPALSTRVNEIRLFVRTPSWVLPKDVRDFTAEERAKYAKPRNQKWSRFKTFRMLENVDFTKGFRRAEGPEQEVVRRRALAYLESAIEDPELRRTMTPSFPVGCKRIILDSDFYPSLNRANVHVIPHAVRSVDRTGVVDTQGQHHQVDAIVMATGFTPTNYLASLDVVGRDGQSIHQVWGQSPRAFCGMTVPGFPNFFMLYGPNNNGSVPIMALSTRQAQAIVSTIRRMERRNSRIVDTKPEALADWILQMDEANAKRTSSLTRYCTNYYHSPDGQNVTQMPMLYRQFVRMMKFRMPRGLTLERQ